MNLATPPPKLNFYSEAQLKHAIGLSIAVHALIIAFLVLKSIVMPETAKEFLPSLRVDLVALPDHKLNEQPVIAPPVEQKPPEKEIPEEKKPDIKVAPEVADKPDFVVSNKKAEQKKKSKEKIKNALAKIRALERVAALERIAESPDPIKGNQISKGSSISGEAKTSLETTYFDVILEKVRSNWELPQWLQDQNFSAKVMIFIDRNGQITSSQFVKSSGNDQFDQEVKRALNASSPFPTPPSAILQDLATQGVTLGFPL